MAKIFEINKNQPDSQQMSSRAVIAILPFEYTEVIPIRVITQNNTLTTTIMDDNKLKLRSGEPLIVDSSEILALNITEDKKSPIGTLSTTLQPSQYNYLEAANPGDYIFAWICKDTTTANDLIDRIRQQLKCNDPKYGLKFFGKIYSGEEVFQISQGVKTVRYNITAQSFDYYQTPIFNTPEAIPFAQTNEGNLMYQRNFFSELVNGITSDLNNQIFNKITFNTQDQVSYLHQAFMGSAQNSVPGDALFKSLNNMFALPQVIGKLFGRDVQNQNSDARLTFSDVMNIIIGVQNFDDAGGTSSSEVSDSQATFTGAQFNSGDEGMGPNFNKSVAALAGRIYQPDDKIYKLKGYRLINITPSMQGTIWQILKEHSNPLVNEMYTCLRLDPKENFIFPSFVCRQIPMSFNAPNDDFSVTYFDELPRFRIDESNILSYSFNKNNELRMNMFFVKPQGYTDIGMQQTTKEAQDALTLSNVGYQLDAQDAQKHGVRPFISNVYETFNAALVADQQRLAQYTQFLRDVNSNLHLKLNGNLQTWGISDFICIGENLQIGDDLLFHIERITHSYSINGGLPIFRTTFELSHGLALDSNTMSVRGSKNLPSTGSSDEVFTEFKPSYNIFLPTKSGNDPLAKVKGNSFYTKSVPDTSQETLSLDKTNGEE